MISSCLCLALVGCSSSSTTSPGGGPGGATGGSNADKIVGVWSVTKIAGKELPVAAEMTMEFSNDGKMIFMDEEALYKVEGEKLNTVRKGKDGKEDKDTMTIKSVTGDNLVLINDKRKEEMELKRKKK